MTILDAEKSARGRKWLDQESTAEGSVAFDVMRRDRDVGRLFNDGALSFTRPGQ